MTVWKYILANADTVLEMPADARVMHAHEQGGQICVWAEVDPGARRTMRRLVLVGTGHEAPAGCEHAIYVGSAHLRGGAFVFHVYDYGEIAAPTSRENGDPQ